MGKGWNTNRGAGPFVRCFMMLMMSIGVNLSPSFAERLVGGVSAKGSSTFGDASLLMQTFFPSLALLSFSF